MDVVSLLERSLHSQPGDSSSSSLESSAPVPYAGYKTSSTSPSWSSSSSSSSSKKKSHLSKAFKADQCARTHRSIEIPTHQESDPFALRKTPRSWTDLLNHRVRCKDSLEHGDDEEDQGEQVFHLYRRADKNISIRMDRHQGHVENVCNEFSWERKIRSCRFFFHKRTYWSVSL